MHALVLQCGGPTAVVNTSLAAVVRRWRASMPASVLSGGHHGLRALLTADWRTLTDAGDGWLAALDDTPGMALGGGRDRLSEPEVEQAVGLLAARGVEMLFLIGGNGTMAAGPGIAGCAARAGVPLRIIAVPKTIDNDIPHTDVCPGFPSAARFVVDAVRDIGADVASMRGYEDVVLIETMGRHAGWLAAATTLARSGPEDAPHLVLVPEEPCGDGPFLSAVRHQHARTGQCVVTVAEGARDSSGAFFAERGADPVIERDASGQVVFGRSSGPLLHLSALIRERLGLRCRTVRPDVLQRCSLGHVSRLDRQLAAMAGTAAVDAATSGQAGDAVMIALRLAGGRWTTSVVPLDQVRGERTLPPNLLLDAGPIRHLLV
jgi:ATP-dependent phosphofructokinase / diphosphate-dependent phosphofructokinase